MPDGGTFVNHHDAVRFEFVDVLLGLVSRRLDDFDAAFDGSPAFLAQG